MLFKDEPHSVYGDTCCHFNALGNQRVAQAIGGAIAGENDAPEQ
jgi:hypothetical protein